MTWRSENDNTYQSYDDTKYRAIQAKKNISYLKYLEIIKPYVSALKSARLADLLFSNNHQSEKIVGTLYKYIELSSSSDLIKPQEANDAQVIKEIMEALTQIELGSYNSNNETMVISKRTGLNLVKCIAKALEQTKGTIINIRIPCDVTLDALPLDELAFIFQHVTTLTIGGGNGGSTKTPFFDEQVLNRILEAKQKAGEKCTLKAIKLNQQTALSEPSYEKLFGKSEGKYKAAMEALYDLSTNNYAEPQHFTNALMLLAKLPNYKHEQLVDAFLENFEKSGLDENFIIKKCHLILNLSEHFKKHLTKKLILKLSEIFINQMKILIKGDLFNEFVPVIEKYQSAFTSMKNETLSALITVPYAKFYIQKNDYVAAEDYIKSAIKNQLQGWEDLLVASLHNKISVLQTNIMKQINGNNNSLYSDAYKTIQAACEAMRILIAESQENISEQTKKDLWETYYATINFCVASMSGELTSLNIQLGSGQIYADKKNTLAIARELVARIPDTSTSYSSDTYFILLKESIKHALLAAKKQGSIKGWQEAVNNAQDVGSLIAALEDITKVCVGVSRVLGVCIGGDTVLYDELTALKSLLDKLPKTQLNIEPVIQSGHGRQLEERDLRINQRIKELENIDIGGVEMKTMHSTPSMEGLPTHYPSPIGLPARQTTAPNSLQLQSNVSNESSQSKNAPTNNM